MEPELWQLDDEGLLDRLRRAAELRNRADAEYLATLDQIEKRGAHERRGNTLVDLQQDVIRISRAEAGRREKHMRALRTADHLAAAVHDAAISSEHLAAVTKTLDELPEQLSVADREFVERTLVDHARISFPEAVKRLGREIKNRLDQDGHEPTEQQLAEPLNELHWHQWQDGRLQFRGELAPEPAAVFVALISSLAKAQHTTGQRDIRTPEELRGDAFEELLHLTAKAATAPAEGGQRPHLAVTISHDALRDGIGQATLGSTGRLTAEQARLLACDAGILPMVLGSKSQPLDIGRQTRVIPAGIRRAVEHRDIGCAFPDCDRSARWADVHHIRHWANGGPTCLDNCALLCRRHHRIIHHTAWEIRMRDHRPEFIPPAYVDPDQVPRTNLIRHPPLPKRA